MTTTGEFWVTVDTLVMPARRITLRYVKCPRRWPPAPSAALRLRLRCGSSCRPRRVLEESVGTPRRLIVMPAHRPGGRRLRAAAI